jgi:hypothetical protein
LRFLIGFGAASTRRSPAVKRSIVPTGSSAGTSTGFDFGVGGLRMSRLPDRAAFMPDSETSAKVDEHEYGEAFHGQECKSDGADG